ncbi:MAG TPA: hypothetical protein VND65_17135 [Candidatus Binatia bacterium]|nr:hypothetical protein [Candidatus Binatia bacterium]
MTNHPQNASLTGSQDMVRRRIETPWGQPSAGLTEMDLRDMQFLRSWLVYDSIMEGNAPPRRLNWHAVLGLSLATAVSASIWAGIGYALASLWN